MVVKIKEELFFITEQITGMVGAAGLAAAWSDNFRYQVPQDRKYIFRPGHTFSGSFNNSTGAPAAVGGANPPKPAGDFVDATDRIRIELRDAAEKQSIQILQDTRYGLVRHFADRDLIRRLDIVDEIEATAGMWIVIMLLEATVLAPADVDTYFSLSCDIVKQTIM